MDNRTPSQMTEFDRSIVEKEIHREVNSVLQTGGIFAAVLGLGSGTLIAVLIAVGLIKDVIIPGIMALTAGSLSLVLYFIARAGKMNGKMVYWIFIPYLLMPTLLFILSHFFIAGGAAAYITGPFSYLNFFLIVMTGFLFNGTLSRLGGWLTGAGYIVTYLLAADELSLLTGASPTVLQDLTSAPLYFFKAMMMIFTGYITASLSVHFKSLIIRILSEVNEKQSISKLFGKFVSEEVKEKILREKSGVSGEIHTIAVLFSDIRSFTTFSESRGPAQVVSHLNRYFNRMVECITSHGGVVDKFIGDAIMAYFGGVTPIENPCDSALQAASAMRASLAELNREWRERGEPEFDNGIGIHYGEALLGTIGSDERMEFTVIGDTVNLASRTEGLTKQYGTPVMVTDAFYQYLSQDLREGFFSLGEAKVKGKEAVVKVWGKRI
ncbi:MAG: adenylate/guanylate cyclase domain-containing protein [Brevinematales bacterium]|nr:adenylate/guanylate cyclase domain-containing protein [Brevinematales bacterium]